MKKRRSSKPLVSSALVPGTPVLWKGAVLSCFLLALLFSFRQSASYDLGVHLKSGQWIMEHRAVQQVDEYTYAAKGHEYINPSWLYQLLLYLTFRLSGYEGLGFLHAMAFLSCLFLLWHRIKARGGPPAIGAFILFLSLLVMEGRLEFRPELFSWVLLSLTLWVVEVARQGKGKVLLWFPLIQLIWVNLEGLFVLGWAVLFMEGLDQWIRERKVGRFLVMAAAGGAIADFINPYGYRLALFPLGFFHKLFGDGIFKSHVGELQSPWNGLEAFFQSPFSQTTILFFLIFCFLALPVFTAALRRRQWGELPLFGLFFLVSWSAVRNLSLLLLVCAPWCAQGWGDWLGKGGRAFPPKVRAFLTENRWVPIFLMAVVVLIGLRVFHNAYYIAEFRHKPRGWGIDEQRVPIRATDFLRQNQLNGRIFNHWNLGAWLDWRGLQPTYMDGRLEVMGDSLFREFQGSLEPGGLKVLIDRYGPQLVIFEIDEAFSWMIQMKEMTDWRLIYLDESTALYAAPGYASWVPSFSFDSLPGSRGLALATRLQAERVLAPLGKGSGWWEGFYRDQPYTSGLMNLGIFAYNHGQYKIAEAFYLEVLRKKGHSDYTVLGNLAVTYWQLGRYDFSKLCVEKMLQLKPGDVEANRMMSFFGASGPAAEWK